ncbi:MAG: TetR/AcrR family transcriptional regulator [Parasphingorhabdus sp.]
MDQAWLKISDAKNDPDSGEGEKATEFSVTRGRRRSSIKRNEILQVAREQFLANGYDGTSIDSIVDIIGGSKSTIYSHFGNKESLFAAVIRNTGHTADAPDFPLINGNVRDELVAFAENRLRRVLSPLNIGIMRIVIAEAQRLPQIAELFYRNAPEPTYVSLRAYLEVAVARKQLAIDDIEEAADLFIGGLIQRHLLARLFCVEGALSVTDIQAKAERVVDLFISKHSLATT